MGGMGATHLLTVLSQSREGDNAAVRFVNLLGPEKCSSLLDRASEKKDRPHRRETTQGETHTRGKPLTEQLTSGPQVVIMERRAKGRSPGFYGGQKKLQKEEGGPPRPPTLVPEIKGKRGPTNRRSPPPYFALTKRKTTWSSQLWAPSFPQTPVGPCATVFIRPA